MDGWRPARPSGDAARAASAWEGRDAGRPTRQTPAGAKRGPVWASRARWEREPGKHKAPAGSSTASRR